MVRYKKPKKKQNKTTSIKRRKKQSNGDKKKVCLTSVTSKIKQSIIREKPDTLGAAILVALRAARGIKNKIKPTRIVKIPKTGGVLPLIPIFAGLSALGALGGGASGIIKAVSDARAAKHQLEESQPHNKKMEAIAMGKGMYLKPYKTGIGLFLKPYSS